MEPVPDTESPEFANFYWFGVSGEVTQSRFLPLIPDLFKYCLWKFKLKRKIPNLNVLLNQFEFLLEIFTTASRQLRNGLGQVNLISNFLQARG